MQLLNAAAERFAVQEIELPASTSRQQEFEARVLQRCCRGWEPALMPSVTKIGVQAERAAALFTKRGPR